MASNYIELKNVTVDIPIFDSNRSLRRALYTKYVGKLGGEIHQSSRKHVFVRALHDISFRIEEGDRLGLVGHNGAGKSTLLNVLAGIYQPHSGTIIMNGKVTPLFNPNLGLDIDDTGYENIYTRGILLGLTRREINQQIDEIAELTGLGDYLSMPVRTYSSGMKVRLAFAISTSIKPEILLIDEVFGAGDAEFMDRARKRMVSLLDQSSIVIMATHSDELIREFCNKSLLLEGGRVKYFGSTEKALDIYHKRG